MKATVRGLPAATKMTKLQLFTPVSDQIFCETISSLRYHLSLPPAAYNPDQITFIEKKTYVFFLKSRKQPKGK